MKNQWKVFTSANSIGKKWKKETVRHLGFSSRKKMINGDPSVLPGELVLSNVYEQIAPIKLINKPNLCRANSNQSCFVSMASLTPAVSIDLFSVRILSLLNFAFVMSALNQHQFHDISIVGNFQSPFFFFSYFAWANHRSFTFFYELPVAIGKSNQTDKASLEPSPYVNEVVRHQGKIKNFNALCARWGRELK